MRGCYYYNHEAKGVHYVKPKFGAPGRALWRYLHVPQRGSEL
jgi:hypothetical protein